MVRVLVLFRISGRRCEAVQGHCQYPALTLGEPIDSFEGVAFRPSSEKGTQGALSPTGRGLFYFFKVAYQTTRSPPDWHPCCQR